ncbi:hypothetical protein K0H38_05705, partial [Bacteroides xylanisolvens]|uniref:hypothetical protein n=1 Tax=Bacteroides xylanisolvens TaxID=371601 RepID=UPI001F3B35CD
YIEIYCRTNGKKIEVGSKHKEEMLLLFFLRGGGIAETLTVFTGKSMIDAFSKSYLSYLFL